MYCTIIFYFRNFISILFSYKPFLFQAHERDLKVTFESTTCRQCEAKKKLHEKEEQAKEIQPGQAEIME